MPVFTFVPGVEVDHVVLDTPGYIMVQLALLVVLAGLKHHASGFVSLRRLVASVAVFDREDAELLTDLRLSRVALGHLRFAVNPVLVIPVVRVFSTALDLRSEEHTSELQSR